MAPALRRSRRSREAREQSPELDANVGSRPQRQTRSATTAATVTVSRSSRSSSDPSREPARTLRVTVKMPAGKLREATGGRSGRRSVNVFQENPIVSGPRSSRNKKKVVEVTPSDDEDIDDQEEDEVDDEDAPGEDEDEDADADGDLDMDDARHNHRQGGTSRLLHLPAEEDEELDEEVDVTDSDAEGELEDQDESAIPEANAEELDEEDEEDDLDEEMDSDALALNSGKTTKRQRGNLGDDFLQLPMEPQVKKHLTAEERAMRRAEMARRRKNLSEKRNEEEKMDTINRLLRKQPPKRRGRGAVADTDTTPAEQEAQEPEKADPTMVRWISSANGFKVNVPEEWLGTPAGRVFGAPTVVTGTSKMVEEV
ncbi:hypothetical protein N7450_002419 [Penicillium hetheringtonii]|uniref:INO80 complex subunit B-like conserved region domain-containing protein n=1 Tax=Penicillium hetheringtonii TaxID=911720 RepID=A0AAD6GW96_9EURO|nr:hypothetical protein N7450_002419 [Penicillium hetheringtonii]